MNQIVLQGKDTVKQGAMYMSFELGDRKRPFVTPGSRPAGVRD